MKVSSGDNERDPATLIGVEQAAQVLRLSHWAVRYRVKHGLLRFIRRKRRLLFGWHWRIEECITGGSRQARARAASLAASQRRAAAALGSLDPPKAFFDLNRRPAGNRHTSPSGRGAPV